MSKTRAKGTAFEVDVVSFILKWFPDAKRTEFSSPLGDITGTPIVLECKNQKAMTLPAWLDQARKSGEKLGIPFAIVHKRARANVSKTYVTMELDKFAPILFGYGKYMEQKPDDQGF